MLCVAIGILLVVLACVVRIVTWCKVDDVSVFVVEGELHDLLQKREITMLLVPIAQVAPIMPQFWSVPMREPRGVQ